MIKVEREGGCRVLWLARSEKANALTEAMLRGLASAVGDAVAGEAKVLILSGEGKVFSAGADLDEMKAGLGLSPAWEAASGAIAAFPGLTIAALNGTLAGGAADEALAWGLIDRIVPGGDLMPTAKALAADALGADQSHVRALRRMTLGDP